MKNHSAALRSHVLAALRGPLGDMVLEEAGDAQVSWDGDDLVVVVEEEDGDEVRETVVARVRVVAVDPAS